MHPRLHGVIAYFNFVLLRVDGTDGNSKAKLVCVPETDIQSNCTSNHLNEKHLYNPCIYSEPDKNIYVSSHGTWISVLLNWSIITASMVVLINCDFVAHVCVLR